LATARVTDLVSHLRSSLQDKYAVERELGRGGMATVFLAEDLKHGRRVAIKVLHPELAAALGGERFHREIQIASRLTHPHILPVYDSGDAGGSLYYVMPFIEGESLRDRIVREKQLAIEEALRITCEVSDALSYAHSMGVVHRDIKPENILLSGGHAVVADFGIARAISGAADGEALTQTGMSLGTPAYMSPEQASADRDIDGRSDLYSLACVTYELIAGQPPFTAPNAQALMARHALDPVPLLSTVRPAVSDEAEDAIMRALEKVPADRFATVGQFAEALRSCAPTGTFDRRTKSRLTAAQRRRAGSRGSRRRVALITGIMVCVVAGAAWAWHDQSRSRRIPLANKKIAILYFADGSRDRSLGDVAAGLSEALIDELRRARVNVVSRNGVAPFRDADVGPDSIARALQAGLVVDGDVTPAGDDKLKVTVRLLEGTTGSPIDRASLVTTRSELLDARRNLVSDVAGILRKRLGDAIELAERRDGTSSEAAWILVQRAERLRREAAVPGDTAALRKLDESDSLLTQAEALDGRYGAAIVMSAANALRRASMAPTPADAAPWIDKGLDRVGRALELDAQDPAALELRGTIKFFKLQRGLAGTPAEASELLTDAEEDLRAAIVMNRSQASAYNVLSQVSYRKLDVEDAYLNAYQAYQEDAYLASAPDIVWRLFATSYDRGNATSARQWCAEGMRRFPTGRIRQCRLWLMTMPEQRPNIDTAWALADDITKLASEARRPLAQKDAQMMVAMAIGRASLSEASPARRTLLADSARRVLERARGDQSLDKEGQLLGREAVARTMLGDRKEALRLLKAALTTNPEHRTGLQRNTWWFRDLASEPSFRALVEAGR
jgi:serine/threonine-protein kinase